MIRILLLGVLLLNACAMGTPANYPAQADDELRQVPAWSQLDNAEQVGILDGLIHSAELDALVAEALAANPSLRQVLLTLRIREAQLRQTGADRFPSLTAGYSASGQKEQHGSFGASLTVSWELDLWGKIAQGVQAAELDLAEQQALYQSARDTLAAEVMQAWLGLVAAGRNLAIEQERLASLESTETFLAQRYKSGLGSLQDLNSARTSVSSSRASLEGYRETLAQQQRALNALLGRSAISDFAVPQDYPAVLVPLAELPEQTLARRPDLKAAYLAIQAQELRTEVAYKELLPSIDLTAVLQDTALSPAKALFADPVWTLLAQLTAPLYQSGKLKAEAHIAELQTAQGYEAYRETLVKAVQETEDAIGLERSLGLEIEHVRTALAIAQTNITQYQSSYAKGLSDILDLLEVQRQAFDLHIQLNNLQLTRFSNRIDLGLALGLGVHQ